jgi:hypothetical protein
MDQVIETQWMVVSRGFNFVELFTQECQGPWCGNHPGDQSRPVKLMLSAGLAGAVSRTATAPLDRVKFLLIMGNPGLKEKYTIRQVQDLTSFCQWSDLSLFPMRF